MIGDLLRAADDAPARRKFTGRADLLAVPLGMALGPQGAMVVEILPAPHACHLHELRYSITLALGRRPTAAAGRDVVDTRPRPSAGAAFYIMAGSGVIGPRHHVAG
jgi:hypothetical protein